MQWSHQANPDSTKAEQGAYPKWQLRGPGNFRNQKSATLDFATEKVSLGIRPARPRSGLDSPGDATVCLRSKNDD